MAFLEAIRRLLTSLAGSGSERPKQSSAAHASAFTMRQGKFVETDGVFDAWTSGDLQEMLDALELKTNPIDRHFLLMSIVALTYKQRKDPEMAKVCATVAETHLAEFPGIAGPLMHDMGGVLPRVTTFQHYATLLTERAEFERAIAVCGMAISYDLHDNTVSGFAGRIDRIKRRRAGT